MQVAAFCHVVVLLRPDLEHLRPGDHALEAVKIDYVHRTGEFTLDRDRSIFFLSSAT